MRKKVKSEKINLDLIKVEDNNAVDFFVFIKDERNNYIDPKFVLILKFPDRDVMFLPSMDHSSPTNIALAYYPATDECTIKKIEKGVYMFRMFKRTTDKRTEQYPKEIIFIVELNNKVVEITKNIW